MVKLFHIYLLPEVSSWDANSLQISAAAIFIFIAYTRLFSSYKMFWTVFMYYQYQTRLSKLRNEVQTSFDQGKIRTKFKPSYVSIRIFPWWKYWIAYKNCFIFQNEIISICILSTRGTELNKGKFCHNCELKVKKISSVLKPTFSPKSMHVIHFRYISVGPHCLQLCAHNSSPLSHSTKLYI